MLLCVLSEERVTPCLPSVNRGTGTTPLGLGNPGGRLPRVSSLISFRFKQKPGDFESPGRKSNVSLLLQELVIERSPLVC